jgi:hypothetical protein
MADGVTITTRTSLRWDSTPPGAPPAKGDRRPLQERLDAAERIETLSVVLTQPHRRSAGVLDGQEVSSDDRRLGEPLFRFCMAHGLAEACYRAGEDYDRILRRAKIAKGFLGVEMMIGDGERSATLTEAQIEALREAAVMAERRVNALLIAVMPRAPRVLERLCFDRLEPSPYDVDLIRNGLFVLAREFGMLDQGVNRFRG